MWLTYNANYPYFYRMKIISKFLFLLLTIFSLEGMAQQNLRLLSSLTYPGTLAGVWHYAHNGREYALVGANTGISIVDVTDTMSPVILFSPPGITNLWHEVKVWGNYAYAVSEGVDT